MFSPTFMKALEVIKVKEVPKAKFAVGQPVRKDNMEQIWRITRILEVNYIKDWTFFHYDLETATGERYGDISEVRLQAFKFPSKFCLELVK